jgi:hypothetical protein
LFDQSMLPAFSWPSSWLLEPLTTSTRYLNLNDRPRALVAHQPGLVWYATSWVLAVSKVIGPVPTGCVFAVVAIWLAGILDQMCCGRIGAFHRKSVNSVYPGVPLKVTVTVFPLAVAFATVATLGEYGSAELVRARLIENATSAPVSACPSLHFTPGRTLITYLLPCQPDASGPVASHESYLFLIGSYRYRGS